MSNIMPQLRNDSMSSEVESVFDRVVKENVRTAQEIALIKTFRSGVLEKEVLKANDAISALKQKHSKNQGELYSLKSKSLHIQEQFEKFAKCNGELSAKITDLTTRIKQEKREELERLETLTEQLSKLQDLKKTITTLEDPEKWSASLKPQQKDTDINSRTLDQKVEFNEKEFEESQREHTICSEDIANEFELPTEQRTATLSLFEEGAESFQKVLEMLMQEKERLKEQISRLSKDF